MITFLKFGRLWRTARHLKFIQIYRRFWFRIYKPNIALTELPKPSVSRGITTFFAKKPPSLIDKSEWFLLNQVGKLEEIGWQDSTKSKLWRYNQHYFDDLNAFGSTDRLEWHQSLVDSWINDNPPPIGDGWEPYPTSLRIVNWIKWNANKSNLAYRAEQSLAIQARWLAERIEWHLLGNHLFANAKALIFAGLYFEEVEADKWLNLGLDILEQQLPEQILKDGAHFELSPMYHAIIVEDLLDLINVCEANFERITKSKICMVLGWRPLVKSMLDWLLCMSHPDGKISFFNDAAFGIATSNRELLDYAERLGIQANEPMFGLTDLKESGYVRMQAGNSVLIADFAPVGPNYLPGHAHADTLSFELSVNGDRIFVNSGTSEYGIDMERQRQRGTLAHNTVCVAATDSSEVWSGFRVGNKAKITNRSVGMHGEIMFASAGHDGYARMNKNLRHSRKISLLENYLKIEDHVTLPINAEARYYFHPDIQIEKNGNNFGQIMTYDGTPMHWSVSGASKVELLLTTWHPEFGKVVSNQCLVAHFSDHDCVFSLRWN